MKRSSNQTVSDGRPGSSCSLLSVYLLRQRRRRSPRFYVDVDAFPRSSDFYPSLPPSLLLLLTILTSLDLKSSIKGPDYFHLLGPFYLSQAILIVGNGFEFLKTLFSLYN